MPVIGSKILAAAKADYGWPIFGQQSSKQAVKCELAPPEGGWIVRKRPP